MTQPGEFTYRRVHRASPALLIDCLTTPEHLARFWGPDGTTTPPGNIVVDLRPGGEFSTVMVSDADGGEYAMRARFTEIERPVRIVYVEQEIEGGMTTTITFRDLGDGQTEVLTHQTNVPAMFAGPEARAGFETSLRRFDEYIVTLTTG